MNASKPLNILLSTTRTWNCGDDFIAYGTRNLIDGLLGGPNNYITYNRNPDLHLRRVRKEVIEIKNPQGGVVQKVDLSSINQQMSWIYDNSWHSRTGLEPIDLVVFAGTPEWYGNMVSPLTEALAASDVPVIYLGIGNFDKRENFRLENLSEADQQALSGAKLITVRDSTCGTQLQTLDPTQLPCPSLFFSSTERTRRTRKNFKVALNFQPLASKQPPATPAVADYCRELAEAVSKKYECEWVCHYIDELGAMTEICDLPVRYSYDPKDYLEIYDRYDLLITTRVHAAGAAASLGVPAMVVEHSARSETVGGFLAERISEKNSVRSVMNRIGKLQLSKWSASLVAHKKETRQRYEALLAPILADVTSPSGEAAE